MSIKRILVPLPSFADHAGEIHTALSAAKLLAAHVEAFFISPPPPPPRVAATAYGYGGRVAATAAPLDLAADERDRHARAARERFAEACATFGIPFLAEVNPAGALPAATWREAEGPYVELAMRRAAAFDLVIAASAALVASLKDIAEQSLMQTRRPVLLAASRPEMNLTDSAMIAWDESPECWHAVSAAIPFLKLAKSVQIVSVDRDAARRNDSQAEVVAYLRCHGVNASTQIVAPHLRSVGETLLAAAEENNIGMVVMGAYSHSRLREMLLGGATHHVLQNAVARPIFLMH